LKAFLDCTGYDHLDIVIWYEWLCINPSQYPTITGR